MYVQFVLEKKITDRTCVRGKVAVGDENMSLGKNMQKLRMERGWSQKYVADKLHLDKTAISRYESDAIVPSVITLMDMARLYGVTLDELTGFETEKENRLNRVEAALYRLKSMGVEYKIDDELVTYSVLGVSYKMHIKDVQQLVVRADAQYDRMMYDINCALYRAAVSAVARTYAQPWYADEMLYDDIDAYCMDNNDVTPETILDAYKIRLLCIPCVQRKKLWDGIVDNLTDRGVITDKNKDRWKCPFVDFDGE